jgi:hypothetical protein
MGSKSMIPTSSAMPATPAAPTVKRSKPTAPAVKSTASTATPVKSTAPTSTSAFAAPGDCRSVRDDAKRAHRNACRQNAYRSLLHGTFPTRSSKAVGVGGTRDNGTDLAPSNIWLLWRSDDIMAGEREGKKERNR